MIERTPDGTPILIKLKPRTEVWRSHALRVERGGRRCLRPCRMVRVASSGAL
jgi:hypothetical protein